MALPIQSSPIYTLIVPSTEKKLKFRPFLVKEEKSLLLAEQSEDIGFMVETLKKVITDCTFNKVDVETLAVFDLEYILTKLRSKSIGEIAELVITCKNCKDVSHIKVDVSNIEVTKNQEHTKKIPLFDNVGIVMKYPKIDILNSLPKDGNILNEELGFDAIIDCIDYIYDADKIHYSKDQTKEELVNWIENLNKAQLSNIEKFFKTMPKLEFEIKHTCPKCGEDNTRKIEGIQNFF
jgi:DNA-directed RNA polymerase subunit M/transcription elongation factor TFIIS